MSENSEHPVTATPVEVDVDVDVNVGGTRPAAEAPESHESHQSHESHESHESQEHAQDGQSDTLPKAAVGTMFHGMWQFYTDEQRIAVLDKLKGAGVDSVRLDVSWAMLQPDNASSYGTWGTGFVDHVIYLINSRGMKPLVLLWMTPGWANGNKGDHTLPTNLADYARVAKWAANRYNGKVVGWEVWNEQNSTDFLDGADPVAYTKLLKAAYPAFKAGSPTTPVLFGGVQYNDVDWIRRAYDAGAKGSFDIMATHPYMGVANQAPTTADDGTQWTLNHVRAVRDLMVARGDSAKKIWFTEFGWSTHANAADTPGWALGVTEATQAEYLIQSVKYTRATFPYVDRMYWYNEIDLPWGSQQVMNYGLLRADGTAKPIINGLKQLNSNRK
jgi:polysaccharide biosynthesis protein PslG